MGGGDTMNRIYIHLYNWVVKNNNNINYFIDLILNYGIDVVVLGLIFCLCCNYVHNLTISCLNN